jgi:release factor glutamine methyltransferase
VRERAAYAIGEALDEAVARLARADIRDPRREATTLWAAVAGGGMKPGAVWLDRAREPAPDVARRFEAALERRLGGMPFAYAVGRIGFRTLELTLDPRALIPRPETEGLVDLVLGHLRATWNVERGTSGTVADIGTGCGCIALSLAVEGAFERVIAVDASCEAAALARENVAQVRPPVPVEVREGDLLNPLAGERCRAIVSNPPYLTEAEYLDLDPAVRLFEPRDALVSGPDGLAATRALLAGARGLLEPGGLLALEVDERRAERVARLARELAWSRVTVHDDLFGRARYVLAILEEGA